MKRVSTNTLVNVLLLLAGLLLLIFSGESDVLLWVTRIVGALFVLPSLLGLLLQLRGGSQSRRGGLVVVVPAVGGVCFGMLMVIRAALFAPVLVVVLGALLLVLGLYHIVYLTISRRAIALRGWHFVAPVLILLAGVVVLAMSGLSVATVVRLCGVSLLLFVAMTVVEHFSERGAAPLAEEPSTSLHHVSTDDDDWWDEEMNVGDSGGCGE